MAKEADEVLLNLEVADASKFLQILSESGKENLGNDRGSSFSHRLGISGQRLPVDQPDVYECPFADREGRRRTFSLR